MNKDEQIKRLVTTLEHIRDAYEPWTGEDAVAMMNFAHDSLVDWERSHSKIDMHLTRRFDAQRKYQSCSNS